MRWRCVALIPALFAGLAAQEGRRSRPMPSRGIERAPAGRTFDQAPRPSPAPSQTFRRETVGPQAQPLARRLSERAPILSPWARERCTVLPTEAFWRSRDLAAELRARARTGFIPATPFPPAEVELKDYTWRPSGWRVYGFLVPAGGRVDVSLIHPKPAWFRVLWTDKWGMYRPGMKVRIGEPEARYENLESTTQAVYLLVDDPGFWSTEQDPYTLKVQRDFDATKVEGTLAVGIWATPPPVTAVR